MDGGDGNLWLDIGRFVVESCSLGFMASMSSDPELGSIIGGEKRE